MTAENFKYWLEGYISNIIEYPTKEQWQVILEKLHSVDNLNINLLNYIPYNPPIYQYRYDLFPVTVSN
jgi:hypothetical protein